MSEILKFTRWAGSGKGLKCRPMLGLDTYATVDNIFSASVRVYCVTTVTETVAPTPLVVADVLSAALRAWSKDPKGFTFLLDAPGTWWPDPDMVYRISVTFVPKDSLGNGDVSKSFKEVWEVTTLNPDTVP